MYAEAFTSYMQYITQPWKSFNWQDWNKNNYGAEDWNKWNTKWFAKNKINYIKPNFTSWTSTIVDYIFFFSSNASFKIKNAYVHFNSHSDHLPLIIDLHNEIQINCVFNKFGHKKNPNKYHLVNCEIIMIFIFIMVNH